MPPFSLFVLVSLTKTAKKGLELKQNLIEEVRAFFKFFPTLYLVYKGGHRTVHYRNVLCKRRRKEKAASPALFSPVAPR